MAVFRLRTLVRLDLNSNKIKALPELCLWENLTSLDLSNNQLGEIHPLMLLMTKLVEFNVTSNRLRTLPM